MPENMQDILQIVRTLIDQPLSGMDGLRDAALELEKMVRQSIAKGTNPFSKSNIEGHITASGIVIDRQTDQVALIHHAKYDKWLFPGGHCEEKDLTILDAAKREIFEEIGIPYNKIYETITLGKNIQEHQMIFYNRFIPFDIDIHEIPFDEKNSIQSHKHYDLRYLFFADFETINLNTKEVRDFKLVEKTDLRLPEKIRNRLRDPDISNFYIGETEDMSQAVFPS